MVAPNEVRDPTVLIKGSPDPGQLTINGKGGQKKECYPHFTGNRGTKTLSDLSPTGSPYRAKNQTQSLSCRIVVYS